MKLTIKRQPFLKMLTFASQAVPAKSAEVQFQNFLLNIKEDSIEVIASDGTLSTKVVESNKDNIISSEEGSIQIPAKTFLDIVSKLGGEVITLDMVDTNFLNISDENSNFNIVTKEGEEYPDISLVPGEDSNKTEISVKEMKTLFDTTSYAVATKGPKELYYGINISVKNGRIYFLATDSYRLARYSSPIADSDSVFSFICPVKALSMVSGIDNDGLVSIYFDSNKIIFQTGQYTISTRLLSGDFPDADRIIPTTFKYVVTLGKDEFLQAAERVRIISAAEDNNSQVRLNINKDRGVTLHARSATYGNSEEVLKKARYTMPEEEQVFEIGFNIDFATSAVKALRSDEVTFAFTAPTRMFMVKSDDAESIHIITPIRISNF